MSQYPPNQPQQPEPQPGQYTQYPQPPSGQYPQYSQPPMQGQPPFQQYPQQPPQGYQFPPQPGQYVPPPQPPKRKSRKGLWIALAIGLVVVIAFCSIVSAAISGASKTVATTTSATTNTSSAATTNDQPTAATSGNTVVQIGHAITVDEVSCTATSAQVLQPDSYITPKQGKEFIVVHVKMVNTGTSEQSYNLFDFHAKSSAGNITDAEFSAPSTYTKNNILDSGTLAPGGKVEGDLIFQIPTGDAKAQMTWSPSFFNTSSQYAWVLNVK